LLPVAVEAVALTLVVVVELVDIGQQLEHPVQTQLQNQL
jgi:hypothetical protein